MPGVGEEGLRLTHGQNPGGNPGLILKLRQRESDQGVAFQESGKTDPSVPMRGEKREWARESFLPRKQRGGEPKQPEPATSHCYPWHCTLVHRPQMKAPTQEIRGVRTCLCVWTHLQKQAGMLWSRPKSSSGLACQLCFCGLSFSPCNASSIFGAHKTSVHLLHTV